MAITLELHSTRWVDPESPRPSLFSMTVVKRYVTHVPNYLACIQSWVIPASLDETRNLLTTHWKMAITLELHSTRWVAPESPRPSLFRMTDVGRYVTHIPNYLVCIQDWVIPASLDETRNLLTTRWEMAIS